MKTIKKQPATAGFTLIEILIVIGIIAILAAIVLVAVNPAKQFAKANNAQRASNINAILNAVGQVTIDYKGAFPVTIPATPTEIGSATGKIDLCGTLVADYLPALPADPTLTDQSIDKAECTASAGYTTGYKISKDIYNRVTVSTSDGTISVIR